MKTYRRSIIVVLTSLLCWLVLTSGIALVWPAERWRWDPFVLSPALLWSLIVATMFCLGTLVRSDELQPLKTRPWWVALGVAAQVLVMPAAAWLVTRVVPMSTELAAGVILVGCVPGAMASNVLTNAAGGSVAFSVSLTTVATLLSPITVPTALWIFADVQTEQPLMNPTQTAVSLFLKVVLPTVVGYLLARRFAIVRRHSDRWASPIASIALLWIIASVVAGNRSRLIDLGWVLAIALLAINLIGYAGGYLSAVAVGLPDRFRRALTLEVGMQNAGLGTVLAASLYGEQTIATIPTAAYTFGCMLTGTVLAGIWRKRQPRG